MYNYSFHRKQHTPYNYALHEIYAQRLEHAWKCKKMQGKRSCDCYNNNSYNSNSNVYMIAIDLLVSSYKVNHRAFAQRTFFKM